MLIDNINFFYSCLIFVFWNNLGRFFFPCWREVTIILGFRKKQYKVLNVFWLNCTAWNQRKNGTNLCPSETKIMSLPTSTYASATLTLMFIAAYIHTEDDRIILNCYASNSCSACNITSEKENGHSSYPHLDNGSHNLNWILTLTKMPNSSWIPNL